MAFPTAQEGGPARGCPDRHGWMPRGHGPTSSAGGLEHGQMVAARTDRESFLARLGLSLAATAWLLGVFTSGIGKAVARAERPSVHQVNNVPLLASPRTLGPTVLAGGPLWPISQPDRAPLRGSRGASGGP